MEGLPSSSETTFLPIVGERKSEQRKKQSKERNRAKKKKRV